MAEIFGNIIAIWLSSAGFVHLVSTHITQWCIVQLPFFRDINFNHFKHFFSIFTNPDQFPIIIERDKAIIYVFTAPSPVYPKWFVAKMFLPLPHCISFIHLVQLENSGDFWLKFENNQTLNIYESVYFLMVSPTFFTLYSHNKVKIGVCWLFIKEIEQNWIKMNKKRKMGDHNYQELVEKSNFWYNYN